MAALTAAPFIWWQSSSLGSCSVDELRCSHIYHDIIVQHSVPSNILCKIYAPRYFVSLSSFGLNVLCLPLIVRNAQNIIDMYHHHFITLKALGSIPGLVHTLGPPFIKIQFNSNRVSARCAWNTMPLDFNP